MSELRGIQLSSCFRQNSSFSLFKMSGSRELCSIIRVASSVSIVELTSVFSGAPIDELIPSGTDRWLVQSRPKAAYGLRLLLARIDTNVENIATTKDEVTVVGCWRVAAELRSAFKDDVHVTVGIYHAAVVLDIILESNVHFSVKLLHE